MHSPGLVCWRWPSNFKRCGRRVSSMIAPFHLNMISWEERKRNTTSESTSKIISWNHGHKPAQVPTSLPPFLLSQLWLAPHSRQYVPFHLFRELSVDLRIKAAANIKIRGSIILLKRERQQITLKFLGNYDHQLFHLPNILNGELDKVMSLFDFILDPRLNGPCKLQVEKNIP